MPQIKKFCKTDPPKWEFLFKIEFWNFQKQKNKRKKDTLKLQKIKNIYKEAQIKKFYKTDSTKSGNSDSKNNIEIFKNQKSNSKKTPRIKKKFKAYIRRPQIKKFYKTDPP